MTAEQFKRREKKFLKVRSYTIRYCRENLNYQNVDIAKAMNVSRETINRAYQKVKNDDDYDRILKGIKVL
jgi:predicted regulator of amino acid metabolism with ACT domain